MVSDLYFGEVSPLWLHNVLGRARIGQWGTLVRKLVCTYREVIVVSWSMTMTSEKRGETCKLDIYLELN